MKPRKKPKSRLTGISFSIPLFGGGATWENSSDEREVRARSERADAFSELWEIAQSAQLGMRNDFDRVDELADVHRQLNTLLIRKAPALEPADVELARGFIDALGEFISVLRPMSGEAADRMRGELALTAADLDFRPAELKALEDTYRRIITLNESLLIRYRAVVFGESGS